MTKQTQKQQPKTIYQKLNKIQQNLKAPKNQYNKFANFNYRSCEDVLEAVKPLLGDCVLIIKDEIVLIGNRYYVKAIAALKDKNGEIEVSAYARETEHKKGMDESQITGATSSYARKYALNGLFAIDDTKDEDTKDNTKDNTKESNIDKFERAKKMIEQIKNPDGLIEYSENLKKSTFNTEQKKELQKLISLRVDVLNN